MAKLKPGASKWSTKRAAVARKAADEHAKANPLPRHADGRPIKVRTGLADRRDPRFDVCRCCGAVSRMSCAPLGVEDHPMGVAGAPVNFTTPAGFNVRDARGEGTPRLPVRGAVSKDAMPNYRNASKVTGLPGHGDAKRPAPRPEFGVRRTSNG